jgi:hypothetical protein
MPLARAYLPATLDDLDTLAATRSLPVTSGVAVAPGAPELMEHLAWVAAAERAAEVAGEGRRVVVSADVDTAAVTPAPGAEPTAVTLVTPVPLKRVVSLHVDEEPGSGLGDLLWYDVTELDQVRALLSS